MFTYKGEYTLGGIAMVQLIVGEKGKGKTKFLGFVSGIISQDHDLEQMYFDSFLKIANLEGQNITGVVAKLDEMSEKFGVDFVLSVSRNESELDDSLKSKIIVSI